MKPGPEQEEPKNSGGIRGAGREEKPERLAQALREFRDTAHALSDRSEVFWENQRHAIRARLERRERASGAWRPAWAWTSAAILVGLGLTLLLTHRDLPKPDFAAGYDQQLLLDVDRALDRDLPAPLEPAALLPDEMFPRVRILPGP